MTRFNDYIVEKTSKKEFEAALSNKNIKAGCEFEFYVNNNGDFYRELSDLYSKVLENEIKAQKIINNYQKTKHLDFGGKLRIETHKKVLNLMLPYLEFLNKTIRRHMKMKDFTILIEEWVDKGEINIDRKIITKLSNYIKEKDILDSLHFPYGPNPSKWEVTVDDSLESDDDTTGVEVITPILTLPELIESIEKVFEWIDKNGRTDDTTGFHIHMSIDNTKYELDPLKLILFIEEGLIYKYFNERKHNVYALPVKHHISGIKEFSLGDLRKIANNIKPLKNIQLEKHMGIHFVDIEDNHVEFRYMGDEYHKKLNEVKKLAVNYAHWLSVASDPEYKKQEYIKKVNKVINVINYTICDFIVVEFTKRAAKFRGENDNAKSLSREMFRKIADGIIKPYEDVVKSLKRPEVGIVISDKILFDDESIFGTITFLIKKLVDEVYKKAGDI